MRRYLKLFIILLFLIILSLTLSCSNSLYSNREESKTRAIATTGTSTAFVDEEIAIRLVQLSLTKDLPTEKTNGKLQDMYLTTL